MIVARSSSLLATLPSPTMANQSAKNRLAKNREVMRKYTLILVGVNVRRHAARASCTPLTRGLSEKN